MRPFLFILSAMVLMSLAFWAYRENYATQRALKDVSNLNQEIADLREALSQQRAEWAYLNRPDRLRELADEGVIGSLAARHFSFMGATPPEQMEAVARDLAPILKADKVDAVVFCPV